VRCIGVRQGDPELGAFLAGATGEEGLIRSRHRPNWTAQLGRPFRAGGSPAATTQGVALGWRVWPLGGEENPRRCRAWIGVLRKTRATGHRDPKRQRGMTGVPHANRTPLPLARLTRSQRRPCSTGAVVTRNRACNARQVGLPALQRRTGAVCRVSRQPAPLHHESGARWNSPQAGPDAGSALRHPPDDERLQPHRSGRED